MTVLDRYRHLPRPASHWRRRARAAIVSAIVPGLAVDKQRKLIDAAYPFGERAMHQYKAWLAERRLFMDILLEAPPNADEAGACEVAHDLVELGRTAEARALLDDQAPNRHARRCKACGAAIGYACVDFDGSLRIVPHAARVGM